MPPKYPEIWSSVLSKLLVWGSLFGVLYLLKSFSLLIFLVFIFSYIQANAVEKLAKFVARRTYRVIIVGLLFLTCFVVMALVIVPQIRDQAVNFVEHSSGYAQSLDRELESLTQRYPVLDQFIPPKNPESSVSAPAHEWEFRDSTLARVLGSLAHSGEGSEDKSPMSGLFATARQFGSRLLAITSQFLLSLLFSFLIVLDLPNLQRGAKSLRNTRLRFVYDEMAENLVTFGLTVGRAFEAQFIVATVNTFLTAAGLWLVNLRGEIAFLSLVVFLCGFVPIAGVFISSVPICLLALAEGGVSKLLLIVALVTAVHALESYVLNPRIFGSHMKLNPVVVMILMTVSGKLFGVWGLILCLPITTYVFQHAIQYRKRGVKELLVEEIKAEKLAEEDSEESSPAETELSSPL